MNCPKDGTALRERERETTEQDLVVIDVCPNCGGIWLDKGELEKLTTAERRYYREDERKQADSDRDDEGEEGGHGGDRKGRGRGRRGGFLGGLFEGFD